MTSKVLPTATAIAAPVMVVVPEPVLTVFAATMSGVAAAITSPRSRAANDCPMPSTLNSDNWVALPLSLRTTVLLTESKVTSMPLLVCASIFALTSPRVSAPDRSML